MSNWLGFSLCPHLRIDEGFSSSSSRRKEDHHPQAAAVMPLRSDGSLCFVDPFSRAADWRFENMAMDGEICHHHVHASENCPKFEDFLGCYSNSPSHYQEEESHGINVNVPPCLNINGENIEPAAAAGGNSTTPNPPSYHHFRENSQTLNPSDPNPEIRGMYSTHVRFETASVSSVAGFKSWLRQTTTFDKKSSHEAANFQTLSLTMTSPGNSQNEMVVAVDNRKRPAGAVVANSSVGNKEAVPRKSLDTFGQRTSQYRGVTRHRWTGRYEAHLWDNSCRKEGQTRKGRQVYLGGYDKEEKAARAYDLAALKYWGPTTHINFPLRTYGKELEEMKTMSRQEFVANLRRKSSGFSRGASVYRGVTRHHQHGRWQARIGRVAGNKDLYLGTFSTQEEAAEAYDIAAIKFRGTSAVTNFGISRYDVKRICSSSTLITSERAKRSPKDSGPIAHEEYNSCASSTSQPLIAICSSEASDELADMVWSANMDETQQKQSGNDANIEAKLVGSCSRGSSINAVSPKGSVRLVRDFGIAGCEGYSESYFPSQGTKFEDGNDGSSDHQNVGNSDLVQHGSMFALWND